MNEFTFKVSEPEANLIVNALAQLPFGQVSGLITKLQDQAKSQMPQDGVDSIVQEVV